LTFKASETATSSSIVIREWGWRARGARPPRIRRGRGPRKGPATLSDADIENLAQYIANLY
jgi:mono/diheme cytochrome c family protein